jgi:hypothetical protein
MPQELIPPDRSASVQIKRSDAEIDEATTALRGKINIIDRLRADFRSGRNAAAVLVEVRKDVAEAQREIVQHHANLIARARKLELTDRFQAAVRDLTRRVSERTAEETKHYWETLTKRLDYYEEFFESRIRETKSRVASGEMSQERADLRVKQYEQDRDAQQLQDRTLLQEIIDANVRVVRRALQDFQPT